MSDHLRDEAGITLIELLISIILLGIIIVPLTNAFIDGINSTTASQKRLSEARSPTGSPRKLHAIDSGWGVGANTAP